MAPEMAPETETPDAPASPPRRRHKGVRLWRALWVVFVMFAVAAVGLVFIANTRVIAVPGWVVERIETQVNAQVQGGDRLALDQLGVGLDLAARGLTLEVLQARLEREAYADRLRLPRLTAELDLAGLVRGRVQMRKLVVDGGILRLTRGTDGRFDLGFGEEAQTIAQLPATWPEALAGLDAVMRHPIGAQLTRVEAEALRVVLSDEATGRRLVLNEGAVTLRRDGPAAELVISADLGRSRDDTAPGAFRLALTRTPGEGAALDLSLIGGRSDDVRMLLNMETPAVEADMKTRDLFSLLRADIDLLAVGHLRENGTLAPFEARLALSDGVVPGWEGATFESAALEVTLEPEQRRLDVRSVALNAPQGSLSGRGQFLAGDSLNDPVVMQFQLSDISADPDGLLDTPARFDAGLLEGRIHFNPFRVEIGQAMLAQGPNAVRAGGEIWVDPEGGMAATLTLGAERVAADTLKALWPARLIPKTRAWLMQNISGGTVTNFAAALRKMPGAALPEITGSFRFEDATLRYLRHLPNATNGSGVGTFHGTGLSLRIDRASVSAGPWGEVAVGGTRFTIADLVARPAIAELDLVIAGPIPAVLSVLDNTPFNVLERARRPADLLEGHAEVRGQLTLPLVRGVQMETLAFAFDGVLRDVRSETLVPGRLVTGSELALSITPEAVVVRGGVALDGLPLRINWQQPLPRVPDAEAAPSTLTGRFGLSASSLEAFGIDLSTFNLRGQAPASFEMVLTRDGPQLLQLTSTLEGLGAAIPALNWRKSEGSAGALAVDVALGTPANVPRLRLSAPGLEVEGAISLREGGALNTATLSRLDVGNWLRAAASVRGQGPGRAPLIAITGGQADLRRAALGGAQGSGGSGGAVDIALDRLIVSEGIVLDSLRAELTGQGGTSGRFTARLNGGAPIAGTLVPSPEGTAVRLRGDNAGATLASAGVFQNGSGGTFELRLLPRAGEGRYNGRLEIENLRVRNAPALASLLSAVSVVGLLEQLDGEGLFFSSVEADFELRPNDIRVLRSAALGPSMGLTADGTYMLGSKTLDLQGVVSPFFMVNGLFGGLFARQNEGLIGIQYALSGAASAPQVRVNPLSVLTPGIFREIFRRPPPAPSQ